MSDMDVGRPIEVDAESVDGAAPIRRPRKRRISKRMAELLAWQARELPALEQTLRELEALAVKKYETKARTKNAIRNATMALHEVLQTLQSFSAHEALVAKSTVKYVHRAIRERVALDVKPKRKRRAE